MLHDFQRSPAQSSCSAVPSYAQCDVRGPWEFIGFSNPLSIGGSGLRLLTSISNGGRFPAPRQGGVVPSASPGEAGAGFCSSCPTRKIHGRESSLGVNEPSLHHAHLVANSHLSALDSCDPEFCLFTTRLSRHARGFGAPDRSDPRGGAVRGLCSSPGP